MSHEERTVVEVAVGRVHEREQVLASVLAKGDETRSGLARKNRFLGRLGADGKVLAVVTHRGGGFGGLGEREERAGGGCCSMSSSQAESRKGRR